LIPGKDIFSSPPISDLLWGSFSGVKRPVREAYRSPPFSA